MCQLNKPLTFSVPLSFEAHKLAERFRSQQVGSQKAKQVYLNTLAVYAVDFYLRCLGVATDLDKSDSHDPLYVRFADVADLWVDSIGKLECRPVLPDSTVITVPAEARDDRVGSVAVQLERSLKQATILGFTPDIVAELPLSQLKSLERFPDFLSQLQQRVVINVRQWFDHIFVGGWQAIETLLGNDQLIFATRAGARFQENLSQSSALEARAWKVIELEQPDRNIPIVLLLTIKPCSGDEDLVEIVIRACPGEESPYLPEDLQLSIRDSSTEVCSAQARNEDNWLQLGFQGQPMEAFSIKVALGNSSMIESFII
jgi:hypothetical protein